MTKYFKAYYVFPIILITLLSCGQNTNQKKESIVFKEDKEELLNIMLRLEDYWNTGRLELMKPFYAKKTIQMPPGQVPVMGRSTLFNRWESYQQQFHDQWEPYVDSIVISGDLAVVRGGFVQTSIPKAGGDGVSMIAKSVLVFERNLEGNWQIIVDIWNASAPKQGVNQSKSA